MVGFIVIGVLLSIFAMVGAFSLHEKKQLTAGNTPALNPTKGLSRVAKKVYHEYMELPEDSRPFPDIVTMLRGLDAATAATPEARQHRSDHFDKNSYMRKNYGSWNWGDVVFTWGSPDYGRHCDHREGGYSSCPYAAYYTLHKEIQATKKSVEEKEAAIALSSNTHHLDMAKELAEALRSETKIQGQVTSEITGKPLPVQFDRFGRILQG